MKLQTIILYGRSGAGKGTQGKLLKEYLEKEGEGRKVLYIETGSGLRDLANKEVHTGELVKGVLDRGGLIRVFLPIWVWTTFLIDNFTGEEHIIFDGIARRAAEPPVVDSALEFYGRKNPTVIHIDVSRKWAFDRLKERGRYDDNDDDINNRLNWYEENVIPAIDYFRNNNRYMFHDIDGEHTVEKVQASIKDRLGI